MDHSIGLAQARSTVGILFTLPFSIDVLPACCNPGPLCSDSGLDPQRGPWMGAWMGKTAPQSDSRLYLQPRTVCTGERAVCLAPRHRAPAPRMPTPASSPRQESEPPEEPGLQGPGKPDWLSRYGSASQSILCVPPWFSGRNWAIYGP